MNDKLDMKKVDEALVKLKAIGILDENNERIWVTQRFKAMLKDNFLDISQSKKILSKNPSNDDLMGMSLVLTLVEWMKSVAANDETVEEMRYASNLLFLMLMNRAPTESTLGES